MTVIDVNTYQVMNPADETAICEVPNQGPAEARHAVDNAARALAGWSATTPRERSDILRRTYDLMLRDSARLADLISQENGKSRSDAQAEVTYAAEFFRWFSEEVVRAEGSYGAAPKGGSRIVVTHRPAGVAALITPWNFPAAMATRKLAPALAAGCTVVLKPASETPLTALAVVDLLIEAGLPTDVVTVVTGERASAIVTEWLEDSRVRKISFTGSTAVGKLLLHQCAERVVNASMELGGNAPFIVTECADLDDAVAGAMIAKFRNGGQACTAANRFYVHEDVYDEFVAKFSAQIRRLTVGDAAEGCDIGPLISASALSRVSAVVDGAVANGATLAARTDVETNRGHFYPPTLLTDVDPHDPIVQDEIFGPVAPVVRWRVGDDIIAMANDTEFGLAAYVFAGSLDRAIRIGEALDVGMVGINRGVISDPAAPFGGTKQSGLGREGAREGLREFQEVQYLGIDWPERLTL